MDFIVDEIQDAGLYRALVLAEEFDVLLVSFQGDLVPKLLDLFRIRIPTLQDAGFLVSVIEMLVELRAPLGHYFIEPGNGDAQKFHGHFGKGPHSPDLEGE